MSVLVSEAYKSRESVDATDKSSTATLVYHTVGTSDETTSKNAIFAKLVTDGFFDFYDGLLRKSLRHVRVGPQIFEARVRYVHPDRKEEENESVGDWTFSFDTTGQSLHVTHAQKDRTQAFSPFGGADAPDFKGAINVVDGQPQGFDQVTPSLRIKITQRVANSTLNIAGVKNLARHTGKVNDNVFLTFEPGELLFLGASGTQKKNGDPEIVYHFDGSENKTGLGLDFGDVVGVQKKGHEFLWVYYRKKEDATGKWLVPDPAGVYVEGVYDEMNFDDLGIT